MSLSIRLCACLSADRKSVFLTPISLAIPRDSSVREVWLGAGDSARWIVTNVCQNHGKDAYLLRIFRSLCV